MKPNLAASVCPEAWSVSSNTPEVCANQEQDRFSLQNRGCRLNLSRLWEMMAPPTSPREIILEDLSGAGGER